MTSPKDYFSVRIEDKSGASVWSGQMPTTPRVGERITIRNTAPTPEVVAEGVVLSVDWKLTAGREGSRVTVVIG